MTGTKEEKRAYDREYRNNRTPEQKAYDRSKRLRENTTPEQQERKKECNRQ
jgi:hypothetical protein